MSILMCVEGDWYTAALTDAIKCSGTLTEVEPDELFVESFGLTYDGANQIMVAVLSVLVIAWAFRLLRRQIIPNS